MLPGRGGMDLLLMGFLVPTLRTRKKRIPNGMTNEEDIEGRTACPGG